MARETTIPLPAPIDAGKGAQVTELKLREPTLGEMDKAMAPGSTAYGQAAKIIGLIAGLDDVVAGRLPASVRTAAMEFVESFAPTDEEIEALEVGVPHTIELADPIPLGSAAVHHFTLQEPTLAQLDRAMKAAGPLRQMILLASQAGGIPLPVAERIPYSRLAEIGKFFRPFL